MPVGTAGWEQPAGGELVDGAGEASVRELAGETGEWFGELDVVSGEVDGHPAVCMVVDVVGGEGGDPVAVSALTSAGLDELAKHIGPGTLVMVGESGSGKTTLLNLFTRADAAVDAVRSSDHKGL